MAETDATEDIFPKRNWIAGLCNPRLDRSVVVKCYGYSGVDYLDDIVCCEP